MKCVVLELLPLLTVILSDVFAMCVNRSLTLNLVVEEMILPNS